MSRERIEQINKLLNVDSELHLPPHEGTFVDLIHENHELHKARNLKLEPMGEVGFERKLIDESR